MAERRSSRARKTHDYAKLEDSSDEEFFDDTPQPNKKKKQKKGDDDDWSIPTEPALSEKVATKTEHVKSKAKKQSSSSTVSGAAKLDSDVVKSAAITTTFEQVAPPVTPVVRVTKTPPIMKRSCTAVGSRPPSVSTPSPQPFLDRTHVVVTPPGGLRLGLSRNQKLRSLHSNIRIS